MPSCSFVPILVNVRRFDHRQTQCLRQREEEEMEGEGRGGREGEGGGRDREEDLENNEGEKMAIYNNAFRGVQRAHTHHFSS